MTSSFTEHKIALEEREDWKIRGKNSESSGRATPDRKDPRVNRGVDHEDNDRDRELHAARQSGRINQAIDVMRDEAFLVALYPCTNAERVLVRGQRAGPVRNLDESAPDRDGEMDPGELAPSQNEQAAECHEEHEREMENRGGVSEDSVGHSREYVMQAKLFRVGG